MSFNKTIQMCIFDGNPSGRIMCELSNWNGRVYKISRNELANFATRPDCLHTGVYFLFGKDADNMDTIYIGEAEKMLTRLKQHLKDKDYWNDCIVVVSKDNILNKAHVKFLENIFYNLAKEANRFSLINDTVPTKSSVSEFDEGMLEEFVENTKLLVNTLGYKAFEYVERKSIKAPSLFYIKAARGADASGVLVSDGFMVMKGSKVAMELAPSISDSIKKLYYRLFEQNKISRDGSFVADYVFTSPSLAASVVMGRNANGKTEWKMKEGTTINDLEKKQTEIISG